MKVNFAFVKFHYRFNFGLRELCVDDLNLALESEIIFQIELQIITTFKIYLMQLFLGIFTSCDVTQLEIFVAVYASLAICIFGSYNGDEL